VVCSPLIILNNKKGSKWLPFLYERYRFDTPDWSFSIQKYYVTVIIRHANSENAQKTGSVLCIVRIPIQEIKYFNFIFQLLTSIITIL